MWVLVLEAFNNSYDIPYQPSLMFFKWDFLVDVKKLNSMWRGAKQVLVCI
jgi:hypothetical protein